MSQPDFGTPRDHHQLVVAVLPEALRRALEGQMGVDVSGITPWYEKYEARGEQLAARKLFERIALGCGFALSDADRQRLASCTDAATVETWVERLSTAASVAEDFGD